MAYKIDSDFTMLGNKIDHWNAYEISYFFKDYFQDQGVEHECVKSIWGSNMNV